ncbi:aldehyde dehydrogenase family protein [Novosphingobium sp. PhB165]|uniref:aldehyde dehydrogenase family protein n=1 Tax=Novosphingobium sp. PhB165 TaxID=2485105 RepID=UPI001A9DFF9D|nr:aldehyde dehydrogenase family protein [Novosphingobium sp. PhB165]
MEDCNGMLSRLEAGTVLPYAGDRYTRVSSALAEAFVPGDAIVICQDDGQILHIGAHVRKLVSQAIDAATAAFHELRGASADQLTRFFEAFAGALERDDVWAEIDMANGLDVVRAVSEGRDIGRLSLRPGTREAMVEGLKAWAAMTQAPRTAIERVEHGTWTVEAHQAPLGTIGFVFEGRPNVLVDACGVLASGNTAVLRIGRDAASTADAIMRVALEPALDAARLPRSAVTLIPPAGREAAWAMCTDRRLSLAVIRGSGEAVRLLGSLATQSGIAVSLHGAGGAWLIADISASRDRFVQVVENSLDRKVCNTLNTCCIPRSRYAELVPALIEGLAAASRRLGTPGRIHVAQGSEHYLPKGLLSRAGSADRLLSDEVEICVTILPIDQLGREWEWDQVPELSLIIVDDLDEAITLLNRYSPKFVASLIAEDDAAHAHFFQATDVPFVGNGFTRWVDGQYALRLPELGLANWEFGRPLGRASILTGAGTHTVRLQMRQTDAGLRR